MSRRTHLSLALATFAIAFAVGMLCFSESRPWLPAAPGARASAATDPAGHATASGPSHGPASDEELLTAIMSAVAEEEPLLRAHRLHDLFAHVSSAELASLFERAVHVEDHDRRDAVLTALLARWVAADLSAASAAVQPFRTRLHAMVRIGWQSLDNAVDTAWCLAAPESAFAEAIAAPNAPWSRNTIWTVVGPLTDGDPSREFEVISRLPAGSVRSELCESAIRTLAEKDTAAAEQKLDLLTEPRQRARVEADILGKLTERDPAAGLARFEALAAELTPGTNATRLLNKILLPAAKKDPAAALAALDGVPDDLYQSAVNEVLVGWATNHPVEALDWAAANGVNVAEAKSIADGNAFNSLLSTALSADRDKTTAWLHAQPASRERDAMVRDVIWTGDAAQRIDFFNALTPDAQPAAVRSVLEGFGWKDTAAAEAWVKDLPPGPVHNAAVENLIVLQYQYHPEQVDTLADAWPAGPERDAALSGLALNFSYRDSSHGVDLATRIAAPAERERVFELITRSWLARDEPAARAWLASTGEIPSAAKRVLLREFSGQ